jgi:hypothetical protein
MQDCDEGSEAKGFEVKDETDLSYEDLIDRWNRGVEAKVGPARTAYWVLRETSTEVANATRRQTTQIHYYGLGRAFFLNDSPETEAALDPEAVLAS